MKKLFTIFIIFFATSLMSQKVNYSGGILKLDKKNYGKNVTLEYDSFFDSYLINYTNINGYRVKERYEGSRVQKIQLASNFYYFFIIGTGKSIEGLRRQK
jgi:hypothetical protein